MVTKGEIQSIDQLGMTCEVRIPFFETAGFFDKVVATATISNTPGSYNGYKEGDIVMVAFDDGEAAQPVVIGLMYKGVSEAAQEARGALSVESINVTKSATIPLNTKLVYERDGSVAQNGQTKYESIADIANKLGDLTAQQSNESVDIVNVTATTNMLKSEISSLPKGASKSVYRSATPPEEVNYSQAEYQSWSSEEDYVGRYLKVGDEYVEVTAENCRELGIQPGVTVAYYKLTLKDGDIWVYSGDDRLFDMSDQYEDRSSYVGKFVYKKDDEDTASWETAETKSWLGEWMYAAKDGYSFVMVTLDNYETLLPWAGGKGFMYPFTYVEHVTKNKQYQWDGEKWVEATDDLLKDMYTSYSSSMTQTAKSIEAKVSKNDQNSGTTVDFGWNILMDDDSPESARQDKNADGKLKWWHAGDNDGVFNIFSKITTNSGEEGAADKTQDVNVLHANKNGIHINGNLSVSDSDGNIVFEALPWGSPDHNDVVDSIETPIKYDGNAKVNIAGFSVDAKSIRSLEVNGLTDHENGGIYISSDTDKGVGINLSSGNAGSSNPAKLYIDGIDMNMENVNIPSNISSKNDKAILKVNISNPVFKKTRITSMSEWSYNVQLTYEVQLTREDGTAMPKPATAAAVPFTLAVGRLDEYDAFGNKRTTNAGMTIISDHIESSTGKCTGTLSLGSWPSEVNNAISNGWLVESTILNKSSAYWKNSGAEYTYDLKSICGWIRPEITYFKRGDFKNNFGSFIDKYGASSKGYFIPLNEYAAPSKDGGRWKLIENNKALLVNITDLIKQDFSCIYSANASIYFGLYDINDTYLNQIVPIYCSVDMNEYDGESWIGAPGNISPAFKDHESLPSCTLTDSNSKVRIYLRSLDDNHSMQSVIENAKTISSTGIGTGISLIVYGKPKA